MAEQTSDGIAVGQESLSRVEMGKNWEPIEDLLGGTRRMREVAIDEKRNLPQFAKESDPGYAARVSASFLHNFYGDTVARLVCKPFSEPVAVDEERLPDYMKPLVSDMDMNGTTLQQFAQDSFEDAVNFGLSMAVTDYTELSENLDTRAAGESHDNSVDEKNKARPRVIRVYPPAYLGYSTRTGKSGEMVLTQFRYREQRTERDGQFGEKLVDYVIVLGENFVQEWKKDADAEEYEAQESKPHTFGRVPLDVWYTNRKGYLFAKPYLQDLGWITIDHWQSYSDQRNILHIARVPILFRKGIKVNDRNNDGKPGGGFVLGASRVLSTESEKADMKYVEPAGGAISAGKEHLEMLERRADVLGSDPLKTSGPVTATGELRAESKATCALLAWIEAEEDFLDAVFRAAASWAPARGKIPEDWHVEIYKEFDLTARSGDDYKMIQEDAKQGRIPAATCTGQGKRLGVYPDEFDPDKEAALVASELPPIVISDDDEGGESEAA